MEESKRKNLLNDGKVGVLGYDEDNWVDGVCDRIYTGNNTGSEFDSDRIVSGRKGGSGDKRVNKESDNGCCNSSGCFIF